MATQGNFQEPTVNLKDVVAMMQGMNQQTLAQFAEIVKEMKKPYVDEALVERNKRERRKMKQDLDNARKMEAEAQKRCPHKFKGGTWAIALVHNFPDRQTRGRCNLCRLNIYPEHWDVAYDKDDPAGKPFKVAEHPLYHIVREIEMAEVGNNPYALVG